jgi:hypothetical protein
MNYKVSAQTYLSPLAPACASIAASRGVYSCDQYELEDTILRAGGFAWDIGAEAAPLHAQIQEVLAAKALADADAQAAAELAAANYVPQSVTPWQMRRALNQLGLRATVESAVAAGDQDARDGWEFALEIRRDNPLLAGMAAALGMTDAQLDDLFRLAASFQ